MRSKAARYGGRGALAVLATALLLLVSCDGSHRSEKDHDRKPGPLPVRILGVSPRILRDAGIAPLQVLWRGSIGNECSVFLRSEEDPERTVPILFATTSWDIFSGASVRACDLSPGTWRIECSDDGIAIGDNASIDVLPAETDDGFIVSGLEWGVHLPDLWFGLPEGTLVDGWANFEWITFTAQDASDRWFLSGSVIDQHSLPVELRGGEIDFVTRYGTGRMVVTEDEEGLLESDISLAFHVNPWGYTRWLHLHLRTSDPELDIVEMLDGIVPWSWP